jgi:hypothetical protein
MIYFFIELLILIGLFLILWNRGRVGWTILLISLGARKRRSEDVSDKKPAPMPELEPTIAALSALGFTRLGEVQVKIPGGQTAGSRVFISSDKTVFAELTETQVVVFTTVFTDDAVLETGFPVGETIETRNFRSHTVTTGLEKAYQYHRRQIETFGKAHGVARPVGTMQDYLAWDAMYRRRYVSRKMQRHTWLGLLEVWAFTCGLLALLMAVVYWLGTDLSTIDPMITIALYLIIILIPIAIADFAIPYIGYWGDRRGKKTP